MPGYALVGGRAELAHPVRLRIPPSAEEDLRSVGRAHSDQRLVARALLAGNLRREELGGAAQRRVGIADRKSDARHGGLRPTRLRTTEDYPRGTLRPQFDALRPVTAMRTKAQLCEQFPHIVRRLGAQLHVADVGGPLDDRQGRYGHAGGATARRRAKPGCGLMFQPAQGAPRINRCRSCVGLAKSVVEDLERDRARHSPSAPDDP